MFYTGLDPLTMKEVYVPKSKHEKAMQRALLQYKAPRNYELVHAALKEADRDDLIGYGPKCLIKPKEDRGYGNRSNSNKKDNVSRSSKNNRNNKNSRHEKSRGNKKENNRGTKTSNNRRKRR